MNKTGLSLKILHLLLNVKNENVKQNFLIQYKVLAGSTNQLLSPTRSLNQPVNCLNTISITDHPRKL